MALRPPSDPPPPRPVGPSRRRRWPLVVGGVVLLGMLLFAGCVAVLVTAGQDPTLDTGPVVTVTEGTTAPARTVAPTTTTPRSTTAAAVTAGLYEVGSEIQPGTYRTSGGDGCYWARLRNFDGDLDSVITNGLIRTGPARVTVKRTDVGVEFSGPCAWTKVR